jgi:hypothetical protein
MPTIASRLRADPPPSPNFRPETHNAQGFQSLPKPPLPPAAPPISPTLRSPLPNLIVMQPDSLRQYYAGGKIPQYRFSPLKPIS